METMLRYKSVNKDMGRKTPISEPYY